MSELGFFPSWIGLYLLEGPGMLRWIPVARFITGGGGATEAYAPLLRPTAERGYPVSIADLLHWIAAAAQLVIVGAGAGSVFGALVGAIGWRIDRWAL
jgi:hypothetical protein